MFVQNKERREGGVVGQTGRDSSLALLSELFFSPPPYGFCVVRKTLLTSQGSRVVATSERGHTQDPVRWSLKSEGERVDRRTE